MPFDDAAVLHQRYWASGAKTDNCSLSKLCTQVAAGASTAVIHDAFTSISISMQVPDRHVRCSFAIDPSVEEVDGPGLGPVCRPHPTKRAVM